MNTQPNNTSTQPSTIPTTQHDLASAVELTKEFHGRDDDDIFTWIRELSMFITFFKLDEENAKKLFLRKLKGRAQTWIANVLAETPWDDVATIFAKLKKQFANTDTVHQKLNLFLKFQESKNKTDFYKMLEMADDIYQRNSIQELSLIKLTIARSPTAIRSLLVKHLHNDGEWYSFIREAKDNAWIRFPHLNYLLTKTS
ncbi:hypothetical protein COBT_002121 [Conglomerata obtusa]